MAAHQIYVHTSFEGHICHCCGNDEDVLFMRFRAVPRKDYKAPREVFLRLCRGCARILKAMLP